MRRDEAQKELIRIVKSPEGTFSVDLTGRANGRGAYLCPGLACFDLLKKNKGLNRSYKENVPESVYDELRKVLEHALED